MKMLERHYHFKGNEFDTTGNFLKGDANIMDLFFFYTEKFHEKFDPFYANQLFTSPLTMLKLERSCQMEADYSFGMETVHGVPDMEFNEQMEKHLDKKLIYAMSTNLEGQEEEPVWLYIDNNLDDDTMLLKYSPDEEDEHQYDITLPEGVSEDSPVGSL